MPLNLNEDTEAIDHICGRELDSLAGRLQHSIDQVDRTLSNLYVTREQLDDASAKINQVIQDVAGLSEDPKGP